MGFKLLGFRHGRNVAVKVVRRKRRFTGCGGKERCLLSSDGSSHGVTFRMPQDNFLEITPELRIPLSELDYRASRSGGPGGQHVNTSSTRIELWWDAAGSPSLTEEQRSQLIHRLGSRLDTGGRLRLVSSGSRSQLRNREDVTDRFRSTIAAALVVRKKRKVTKPSRAAKAARLEAKRRRSSTKQRRRAPLPEE
jgi:ribosome-associated protein